MSIDFLPPEVDELTPKITVIGVGGAGGNAIANMIRNDVQGVDFLVANTDAQALKQSAAGKRIQLGAKITQGLGAGSRPEIGRAAAEETIEAIQQALEGAHMLFIAGGMGGGTGTGAAPVIAKAARDMGILTVGVVTKPFAFEGKRRAQSAEAGIEELQKYVDTLIVIPNQNLFLIANANTTFKEAFELADEVLQQGVRGITDLMVMPGLINLDFADIRAVMQEMGKAMMGTGEAEGDDRALIAAQKAIANPLLDGVSMNGAKGVIVSITGGEDMRLLEVDEAANHIRELVDSDANIIWGSAFNPELEGRIRVSVVATGIDAESQPVAAPRAAEQPRVFSFSTPRRTTAEPAAAAPEPVAEAPQPGFAETFEPEAAAEPAAEAPRVPEPYEPEPVAQAPAESGWVDDGADADELVLGSEEAPEALEAPVAAEPTPELGSGNSSRRRWLTGGSDDEEPAAEAKPAKKAGGTLFERMASASRGGSKSGDDDDKDPLDIPRFLRSQNNQ
ncbi:MAG: cell division protein FtsZ [Sphingomonadales bacterium]|nr:MAG: cell division protein FtsZ [Sphingomonadales bacterium]